MVLFFAVSVVAVLLLTALSILQLNNLKTVIADRILVLVIFQS